MKYQIGDKIIVLHSDEEGMVTDIINEKMVMIEVRGVRFPAYMDQIDFPYFKLFSQKKVPEKRKLYVDDIKPEKKVQPVAGKKQNDGVYLNFIPVFDKDIFDDDVVEKMKVYLVNQNEEGYNFTYNLFFSGTSAFELKNTLHPLTEFYLHDVAFEDMSDNPKFAFEFSLQHGDKRRAPYVESTLKLKAKQLFKKMEDAQLKNEPSFAYELFVHYPNKQEEERVDLSRLGSAGYRVYDAGQIRQHLAPARSVVDLHIEKLTDDWGRLSSGEILHMQLREFEKYYELSVAHMQPSLIIIHGVGEGRLRDEIHHKLKLRPEVSSFVNQFHPLYGYGATEIYFRY